MKLSIKNLYNNLKLLSQFNSTVLEKIVMGNDFENLAGYVFSAEYASVTYTWLAVASPTPNTVLAIALNNNLFPKTFEIEKVKEFSLAKIEMLESAIILYGKDKEVMLYLSNIVERYYWNNDRLKFLSVDHLDGNTSNNNLSNVQLVDTKENGRKDFAK